MRTLSLILMLVTCVAFGQNDGDTKDIDGQVFKYNKGVWVHDALGDSYTLSDEYTSVYKDPKWNKWYAEGSATAKKILDLGPNVVFKFKAKDDQWHTWAVFRNSKLAASAVAGGSGAVATGMGGAAAAAAAGGAGAGAAAASGTVLGMSIPTAAVIGGAVVAGGVIVANDNNSNGLSKAKR